MSIGTQSAGTPRWGAQSTGTQSMGTQSPGTQRIGAHYQGQDRYEFRVWAPHCQQVALQLLDGAASRIVPLQPETTASIPGYWSITLEEIPPGTHYQFQLQGQPGDEPIVRPDPASHFQPQDVHGPSQVIDHAAYRWQDSHWRGIPLRDYIIYELHIGTFTPEGTFAAAIARLPDLKDLGITAIELMPVAQFPGDRNWGYDGVYPFAVQASYGGPEGLKQWVDACHQLGLAVILDVVYNHFGPEGNYTASFGPYFTEHYQTPWGAAVNYDQAGSPGVRNFVLENALYWLREFHCDALRLDAIHAIYDLGAKHILAQLQEAVLVLNQTRSFPAYLIAESDLNDVRILHPVEQGGYGLAAQWSDDFHHALHTLLTGENQGYYGDYGTGTDLVKAYQHRFVYDWAYSRRRNRYHGSDGRSCPPHQFVVCAQNHDQVGNRRLGERLTHLVSFEALKLAAGAVLLSPYIPLVFMGEEYAEEAPFLYFISHHDPDLIEAVRQGRQREFAAFHGGEDPPDPYHRETFERSKLRWELRHGGHHQTLWRFYQTLLRWRREIPALQTAVWSGAEGEPSDPFRAKVVGDRVLLLHRWDPLATPTTPYPQMMCLMNFQPQAVEQPVEVPGSWQKLLDSAAAPWEGPGSQCPDQWENQSSLLLSAHSFVLYGMRPPAARQTDTRFTEIVGSIPQNKAV